MARNAMQTARQGAEISGNNLANASNPIYARQRVKIAAAVAIPTDKGPQGSGSEVARIEQVRDYAIDKQLVEEKGVTTFLEAKQRGLQMAESSLGQSLDRQSVDAGDAYSTYGISEGVTDLFNSFQSLSASPTSTTERQTALYNAEKLTDKFKSVDRRLDNLRSSLNKEVKADIVNANAMLEQVAYLASSIGNTEQVSGSANEIRDVMQDALEQLAEDGCHGLRVVGEVAVLGGEREAPVVVVVAVAVAAAGRRPLNDGEEDHGRRTTHGAVNVGCMVCSLTLWVFTASWE